VAVAAVAAVALSRAEEGCSGVVKNRAELIQRKWSWRSCGHATRGAEARSRCVSSLVGLHLSFPNSTQLTLIDSIV
jgi:hypothetical protein